MAEVVCEDCGRGREMSALELRAGVSEARVAELEAALKEIAEDQSVDLSAAIGIARDALKGTATRAGGDYECPTCEQSVGPGETCACLKGNDLDAS